MLIEERQLSDSGTKSVNRNSDTERVMDDLDPVPAEEYLSDNERMSIRDDKMNRTSSV